MNSPAYRFFTLGYIGFELISMAPVLFSNRSVGLFDSSNVYILFLFAVSFAVPLYLVWRNATTLKRREKLLPDQVVRDHPLAIGLCLIVAWAHILCLIIGAVLYLVKPEMLLAVLLLGPLLMLRTPCVLVTEFFVWKSKQSEGTTGQTVA